MKFSFFKQEDTFEDIDILGEELVDHAPDIPEMWRETVVSNFDPQVIDPVRQATYMRIGVVTLEDNTQLPALLSDTQPMPLMHLFRLPRNPRIAGDELYELDGMDCLVVLSGEGKYISKDVQRWLRRLKPLGIPMMVLLPREVKKRQERKKLDIYAQHVGIPIVPVTGNNTQQAREQFLTQALEHMPAMGLALAAHSPAFREPLVQYLMKTATSDSLLTRTPEDVQLQLVRQICAAHGFNEREFEKHKIAMETLLKSTGRLSQKIANPLPFKQSSQRDQFSHAVATLFAGHATSMYLGGETPSLRKHLLPQLWRLYRASRQSVPA